MHGFSFSQVLKSDLFFPACVFGLWPKMIVSVVACKKKPLVPRVAAGMHFCTMKMPGKHGTFLGSRSSLVQFWPSLGWEYQKPSKSKAPGFFC